MNTKHLTLIGVVAVAGALVCNVALADGLADAIDNVPWGASIEQTLEFTQEQMMDEYRADIAGVNDALAIDRMRRRTDAAFERIVESAQEFDATRTGYEVSVLAGELRGNAEMSMITIRGEENVNYYIFQNDQLIKVAVTYDMEALGWISFDEFIEGVGEFLGDADDEVWHDDENGIPHLERVIWTDEETRMRVENESSLFNTYILVYSDVSQEDVINDIDRVNDSRSARRGGGSILDIVSSDDETFDDNTDIVDSLIGGRPDATLEVVVREEATPFWAGDDEEGTGAFGEDDDLEDVEREERRDREREEEEEEEEETGFTID